MLPMIVGREPGACDCVSVGRAVRVGEGEEKRGVEEEGNAVGTRISLAAGDLA